MKKPERTSRHSDSEMEKDFLSVGRTHKQVNHSEQKKLEEIPLSAVSTH